MSSDDQSTNRINLEFNIVLVNKGILNILPETFHKNQENLSLWWALNNQISITRVILVIMRDQLSRSASNRGASMPNFRWFQNLWSRHSRVELVTKKMIFSRKSTFLHDLDEKSAMAFLRHNIKKHGAFWGVFKKQFFFVFWCSDLVCCKWY